MSFLTVKFLDVAIWIWLYLFFGWTVLISAVIYWKREVIRGVYFKLRWSEKVIKVMIHYKSGEYKVYWRLTPSDDLFKIDKKQYIYDADVITKEHDFYVATQHREQPLLMIVKDLFVKTDKDKELIKINETETYEFKDVFGVKEKGKKWVEMHYFYNNPFPLNFDYSKKEVTINANQLKKFQEQDLFNKLLTLKGEKQIMLILIIMVAFNILITAFLLSKEMGWIE